MLKKGEYGIFKLFNISYKYDMERIDDLNLNGKKIIQDTDLFLFGMDSVLLANMVKGTNKSTNK